MVLPPARISHEATLLTISSLLTPPGSGIVVEIDDDCCKSGRCMSSNSRSKVLLGLVTQLKTPLNMKWRRKLYHYAIFTENRDKKSHRISRYDHITTILARSIPRQ